MYLMIIEVSQKQRYIFDSLLLKNNVKNSANIARAVSSEYLKVLGEDYYNEDKNMVYSGGGHTVLQFEEFEKAKDFAKKLTKNVYTEFDGMELFVKITEYKDDKTPAENMEKLLKELEAKKALRANSFKRESFGIEKTGLKRKLDENLKDKEENKTKEQDKIKEPDIEISPYKEWPVRLDDLGGSKDESNFIAVVHIDGNSMGKKVEEIRKKYKKSTDNWEEYRAEMNEFSKNVESAFKDSFNEMCKTVVNNYDKLNNKINSGKYIPVRRIILEGDDVCFVCDGRIGLECAAVMLEKLNEKKFYSAAGVCIVHAKFPFYRAYQTAEGLCSNAKKLIAETGSDVSAIDWHIDYGEMDDTVSEIKQRYIANDGSNMLLRPYFVSETGENNKERNYGSFSSVVESFINNKESNEDMARSKIKEIRNAIRKGEASVEYYVRSNRLEDLYFNPIYKFYGVKEMKEDIENKSVKSGIYIKDKIKNKIESKCAIFDAIEISDCFIKLDRGNKDNES